MSDSFFESILNNDVYTGNLNIKFLDYIIRNNITQSKLRQINGNIDLSKCKIIELPKLFKNLKVIGNFTARSSNLNSFKNFPYKISGIIDIALSKNIQNFDYLTLKSCGGINITGCDFRSLNGIPEYINGDCYCSSNQIETISNLNCYISGSLDLSSNRIQNLTGFISNISGDLILVNNCLTDNFHFESDLFNKVSGYINLRLNRHLQQMRFNTSEHKIIPCKKKKVRL